MSYFHYRCGDRISLINENCTAIRNDRDFDHGIVVTAEPLLNDTLFEIKIDRKVTFWSGNLEIGVTECDPLNFEFQPCASKLQNGTWIMSGTSILKDGTILIDCYGFDLHKLNQDDRVGLMRTSEGDLIFYINGESQGVAVEGVPNVLYVVVDLYGKCVQVSITSPTLREHNNDDCLSGSSVLAIDNDILNVTLGGDLSELSLSSSNSLDIRMDMNVSVNLSEESPRPEKMRFHDRCGSLVRFSNAFRTAERRRPLDEFNNGVVMTHRPLKDNELFEIRIDRLVDKWSGSIEMGITTHNPATLVFPATMTNLRTGTIMMSGCGILTNGKGTRREYGDFNLDELSEGDRVGMMRKPDGNLHYFINGLDQGIAAQRVPTTVWGVIDLYGMTIQVSIVERDEREEQNLITRRNTREQQSSLPEVPDMPEYYDRLTFHHRCGTHAQVVNNGKTALRPNAEDDFNNGVVITARPLRPGEMFEVRLDRILTKWAGSIEIGVTVHNPLDLDFPFTMTNVRSGTWMMTGSGIMHNGTTVQENYGVNLDRLQVGDRVGVLRKESGALHFYVNGVDQGQAATNVTDRLYGVMDLYGQAIEATIVDMFDFESPDTINSSLSNTTLFGDLRFHHVHGKNARIVNNGLTAIRPRPLAEFNEGIVFSSRPLREGELFEVCVDSMVDRWSGSIELGVTAVRPEELHLPNTATDISRDTWMLSGSSIMENGATIKTNYTCDLDSLSAGTRIGVVITPDRVLEFFKDGISQGIACTISHSTVYAVVDLYGQCAQVSLPCASPLVPLASIQMETCPRSDTSASLQAVSVVQPSVETDLHCFSDQHSRDVSLMEGGRIAVRSPDILQGICFSANPLATDELFEVSILSLVPHLAGTLCIGVTLSCPTTYDGCINSLPLDSCYLTGNELRHRGKVIQQFAPSLSWLRAGDRVGLLRTQEGGLKAFVNGEELPLNFPHISETLYVVVDLKGSCSSLSVISRRAANSPLASIRLQDSLEITLDHEPLSIEAPIASEEHTSIQDNFVGSNCNANNSVTHNCSMNNCFTDNFLSNNCIMNTSIANYSSINNSIASNSMTHNYMINNQNNSVANYISNNSVTNNSICNNALPNNTITNNSIGHNTITNNTIAVNSMINKFTNNSTTNNCTTNNSVINNSMISNATISNSTTSNSTTTNSSINNFATNNLMASNSLANNSITNNAVSNNDTPHINYNIKYEIHENHGRNIEVLEDRTCARRVASYNQGIIILQPMMQLNALIQICIGNLDARWQSSLIVGVICGFPERVNLPVTALSLKAPCCIIANDWISINGSKTRSSYGQKLANLPVGGKVGLMLNTAGLQLYIDGEPEEVITWSYPSASQCYVICDLYGQCQEVKVFNKGRETGLATSETGPQGHGLQGQASLAPTHIGQTSLGLVSAGHASSGQISLSNAFSGQVSINNASLGHTPSSLTSLGHTSLGLTSLGLTSLGQESLGQASSGPVSSEPVSSGQDFEKADFESCEKERSETNLTLSLPTTSSSLSINLSNSVSINVLNASPVTRHKITPCNYKAEVEKLKKMMLLPDDFFTNDEPVCYCANCYKIKTQSSEARKDESIVGWVKFPLRNFSNLQTDKWHTAYYSSKLGTVRCILDKGRPLTKEQMKYSNLIGQRMDDVQVVFSPSLHQCMAYGFKIENGKTAHAAFQLFIKPGAYSIAREQCPEWSTKETRAIALHALLLKLRPN